LNASAKDNGRRCDDAVVIEGLAGRGTPGVPLLLAPRLGIRDSELVRREEGGSELPEGALGDRTLDGPGFAFVALLLLSS
jgi:hypothetical protein